MFLRKIDLLTISFMFSSTKCNNLVQPMTYQSYTIADYLALKDYDLSSKVDNLEKAIKLSNENKFPYAIFENKTDKNYHLIYKDDSAKNDYFFKLLELKLKNIDVVIFDFDFCIMKIHSFGQKIQPDDICKRDWKKDFADPVWFHWLITSLINLKKKVFIASFGNVNVIKTYLKLLFESEIFTENNIITPRLFKLSEHYKNIDYKPDEKFIDTQISDGTSMYNKNLFFDKIKSITNQQDKSKYMFFDDTSVNCTSAKEYGYLNTYLVNHLGLCEKWFNANVHKN